MSAAIVEGARLAPIQAIAWNTDCSSIAVSHCDCDVVLYKAGSRSSGDLPTTWTKAATLRGHEQLVSGLDWSKRGDQIISASHDRNAFVWTRDALSSGGGGGGAGSTGASASAAGPSGQHGQDAESGGWRKQMVITRLTKGALCVQWSPNEAKFAIGSAARVVSVGFYDPASQWWACKLIRKVHESSVVAVAWHPGSCLLATGSTDRRVRLFNAHVAGYEPDPPAGALPPGSAFGQCLFELAHEGCGWVHSVAWAPGDEAILYASHDAVVGCARGAQAEAAVRLAGLPLARLAVVSERLAVGAGWEGALVVLTRRSAQDRWTQAAVLGGGGGGGSGGGAAATTGAGAGGGGVVRQMAQMAIGAQAAAAAASGAASASAATAGGHTACVTGLTVLAPSTGAASRGGGARSCYVASAALDGRLLFWDVGPYMT